MHPAVSHVLAFFAYDHLPAPLQEVSKPFHDLAHTTAARAPDSQETTVALRKLLEAKDAAVRASLTGAVMPKERLKSDSCSEPLQPAKMSEKEMRKKEVEDAARRGFESK